MVRIKSGSPYIMLIPDEILIEISSFLPWKTLLNWYTSCRLLAAWAKRRPGILDRSVSVGCGDIVDKFIMLAKNQGYNAMNKIDIVKKIYSRKIHMVNILKLHNNYFFMNRVLNERFKVWSPVFSTSNIDRTFSKWIVQCYGTTEQFETFQHTIQSMVNMVRGATGAGNVVVVGCSRQEGFRPGEFQKFKIYANIYRDGGKRKRGEGAKQHIPTKYWHSPTQYTQSFHALQCMNIHVGRRANVLTTFKIYRNPERSWEWFIRCNFSAINIYCY